MEYLTCPNQWQQLPPGFGPALSLCYLLLRDYQAFCCSSHPVFNHIFSLWGTTCSASPNSCTWGRFCFCWLQGPMTQAWPIPAFMPLDLAIGPKMVRWPNHRQRETTAPLLGILGERLTFFPLGSNCWQPSCLSIMKLSGKEQSQEEEEDGDVIWVPGTTLQLKQAYSSTFQSHEPICSLFSIP